MSLSTSIAFDVIKTLLAADPKDDVEALAVISKSYPPGIVEQLLDKPVMELVGQLTLREVIALSNLVKD